VLVTGSLGFIGKHLMEALGRRPGVTAIGYDLGTPPEVLEQALREADVIYHLAGVNRPQNTEEFQTGNAGFTEALCSKLLTLRGLAPFTPAPSSPLPAPRSLPLLVLSSSIQAEVDNPYGQSKRQAEQAVETYALRAAELSSPVSLSAGGEGWGEVESPAPGPAPSVLHPPSSAVPLPLALDGGSSKLGVEPSPSPAPRSIIFRLPNVFGKWCRPNYNSVTATFCHNLAHDLPITISDPAKELELVYIDDVITAFLAVLDQHLTLPAPRSPLPAPCSYLSIPRSFRVTLGDLAARIRSFRDSRNTLVMPSFADDFTRCLYATYLSYLDGPDFAYSLDLKTDNRGCLAEFMKSAAFGQIFVSRTKPGITRGNHYHHTKTEKFLVLEGDALIRFRPILSQEQGVQRAEPGASSTGPAPASPSPLPSTLEIGSSALEVRGSPAASGSASSPLIQHRVSGPDFRVVDIPPGYTHSIENIGTTELVTLFWASEIFDPTHPDTYPMAVK